MGNNSPFVTVTAKTTRQRIGQPDSQVGKLLADHLHRKHMGKPSRLTNRELKRAMTQDAKRRRRI